MAKLSDLKIRQIKLRRYRVPEPLADSAGAKSQVHLLQWVWAAHTEREFVRTRAWTPHASSAGSASPPLDPLYWSRHPSH